MNRNLFRWLVLVAPTLGCYSTGGGGHHENGAGGFSSGASAGTGAFSSGGSSSGGFGNSSSGGFGNSSSGGFGNSSSGGTDTCGPCPGIACQASFSLQISPDPAVAPANLADVQVQVDGLTVSCYPNGSDCSVYCNSQEYGIPDGHYVVTISATGFVTQTVEFDAVAPTNCGCCGCCPFSFNQQVTLLSDGSPVDSCCAATDTDPQNCGSCGHACPLGASCVGGACQPAFAGCLNGTEGFTNCTDYCVATGQVCAVACGPALVASEQWLGQADCPESTLTVYGQTSCDAVFDFGTGTPNSYRCCCAAP